MRSPRHCPPTAPLKASTLPHQALEGEFRRRIHAGGLQEPGRGSSDTSMSPCPAPSTHMALNLLPGCTCLREHGTRGGRRHCHLFDAATLHMPAPPTRGCSHPQHLADGPSRGLANPAAQLCFLPPQEASPEGTGPASTDMSWPTAVLWAAQARLRQLSPVGDGGCLGLGERGHAGPGLDSGYLEPTPSLQTGRWAQWMPGPPPDKLAVELSFGHGVVPPLARPSACPLSPINASLRLTVQSSHHHCQSPWSHARRGSQLGGWVTLRKVPYARAVGSHGPDVPRTSIRQGALGPGGGT